MSRTSSLAIAAASLTVATLSGQVAVELPPMPLEGTDTTVVRQLEERRSRVEELARGDDRPALVAALAELAGAYASLQQDDAALAVLANARDLDPDEVRWTYLSGVLHQRRRESDQAADAYRQVLAGLPGHLPSLVRLGQVELLSGALGDTPDDALEDAERHLRSALEHDPNLAAAWQALAQVAERRGDDAGAVQAYRRALALQPQASALHYPLALALRRQGDLAGARSELAQRGDREVALSDPWLQAFEAPLESAFAKIQQALAANSAGQPQVALAAYLDAVRLDPANASAQRGLATTLLRLGRDAEAIDAFRTLQSLEPDSANAPYNIGTLLARQGRYAEARIAFQQALERGPDYAEAHFQLALTQLAQRQQQPAQQHLERALELTAHRPADRSLHADAALTLFELRTSLGETPPQTLLADAQAALPEGDIDLRLRLAKLWFQSGHPEEAVAGFDEIVALQPTHFDAHFGGALALLLSQQDARALGWLERAQRGLPDNLALRDALARLLATSSDETVRDGARAVTLASQVMQQQPGYQSAETLAMAYAEAGRWQEAVDLQRQVVERARAEGRRDVLSSAQRRLEGYQRQEPCRAPWLG